ncbi:hypothetical protein [Chryseobacterium oncorhynchi]|uniref:Uncharacterized protein n=1 Tax=Chryseobacterium oncorhynchi TaxID=741074 RepID=A0A316WMG8_9FLAO|nr:hypothetical protein [Chryseobacterium oncorhynchi]PWN62319.1 hypothetical protein C1638_017660 [Chryseobacterium oncorhynchi]
MSKPITILNEWFSTKKKPTQTHFWELIDSFWHKDSKIKQDAIDGLSNSFDGKVDKSVYNQHLTDTDAHSIYLAKKDASNLDSENILAWKDILGVGDLPSNIATVDDPGNNLVGNVLRKDQVKNLYMALADYVLNGKIRADKIEAIGLTELITVAETSLAAFMANSANYVYQKNDMIAIPDGSGNYSLYIYNGGTKTSASSYIATGLTSITIAMVQGLQTALDSKMNKPAINGNFFINQAGTVTTFKSIAPAANYLLCWNSTDFIESGIYNNSGKYGIGTTSPSEMIHLNNGRIRTKAVVFDDNSEILPNQTTMWNRRLHFTDLTGTRRMVMFRDYDDQLALIQSFTPSQKDSLGSAWNGQYSNGSANVYSITPTVIKNDHVVRYLVLQGLNLNVNPTSTSVKFIPVGNPIGTGEVDCLGFQPSADGKSMIVSVYGDTLIANTQYNVVIRTISPITQTHRTTSSINVVTNIESIDISAINWSKVAFTSGQENTIFTTNGGIFSYSSNTANKAYAYEPNQFVGAMKSDVLFPANTNFYLEYNLSNSYAGSNALHDTVDFYGYLGLIISTLPLVLSDNSFIRIVNSNIKSGGYFSTIMWNNIVTNGTKIEPGGTNVMSANIVLMRQGNVYTQFLTVGSTTLIQTITSNTDAVCLSLAITNGSTQKSLSGSIVQAFKF